MVLVKCAMKMMDGKYGHFDASKCINGDDRRSFLLNPSETYLLYWWHRLDEEDVLQFTVCVLDQFQRANSETFTLVDREHASASKENSNSPSESTKREIFKNISRVGSGVESLAFATLSREVEVREDRISNLEIKLHESGDDGTSNLVISCKRRIDSLKGKVVNAKKQCKGLLSKLIFKCIAV